MPDYTILVLPTARKQLDNLSDSVANLLVDEIRKLAANPRPFGCKKLKGKNSYRIRKGNYRIIYEIADNILKIYVIAIGHRREIYR